MPKQKKKTRRVSKAQWLDMALEVLETDGVADEALAAHVVEYARNNGMLMGRTGRNRNVLKLRPPMPFSAKNATLATEILNRAFQNTKT